MTRECGALLGPYQLLYPLHQGGMGAVWCARDVTSGGKVAVKFPRAEVESPEVLACFEREAAIAAEVWADNVVRVRAFGYAGTSPFIVMDFVEGGSCAALADWSWGRGIPLPPALVARIGLDVANALWSVHALVEQDGRMTPVVHRDVSPQNVMIDANARAHLVDFGIASTVTAIRGEATVARAMGKIRYMAPEQALGGYYDQRADVWALGATLFVLLTGRPPFEGARDIDVALLLAEPSAPHRWPPGLEIDPGLRAVVDRCLEKDPSRRFEDAKEVGFALEPFVWPTYSSEHAELRGGIATFLNGCADHQRGKLFDALARVGRRPTPALGLRAVRLDYDAELAPTSCFVRVVSDLPRGGGPPSAVPPEPVPRSTPRKPPPLPSATSDVSVAPAVVVEPPVAPTMVAEPPVAPGPIEEPTPSSRPAAPSSEASTCSPSEAASVSSTVKVPRPEGGRTWSIGQHVLLFLLVVATAVAAFAITNPAAAKARGLRLLAVARLVANEAASRLR